MSNSDCLSKWSISEFLAANPEFCKSFKSNSVKLWTDRNCTFARFVINNWEQPDRSITRANTDNWTQDTIPPGVRILVKMPSSAIVGQNKPGQLASSTIPLSINSSLSVNSIVTLAPFLCVAGNGKPYRMMLKNWCSDLSKIWFKLQYYSCGTAPESHRTFPHFQPQKRTIERVTPEKSHGNSPRSNALKSLAHHHWNWWRWL